MQKTKGNLKLFANITFFYNLERLANPTFLGQIRKNPNVFWQKTIDNDSQRTKRFFVKDNLRRFGKNQKGVLLRTIYCNSQRIEKTVCKRIHEEYVLTYFCKRQFTAILNESTKRLLVKDNLRRSV
jgi:hypothetical protein